MTTKEPERDIQTWLRLTSKNLYVRRRQLDTKAATVFSFSTMMASLGLSTYPLIRHDIYMSVSLACFVLVSFVAMYQGVQAMHPKIRGPGKPTDQELSEGVPRLTTFEHFRNMSEDEYTAAVRVVLADQDKLRKSLTMHIHEVGVQLASRFQRLRWGYATFALTLGIVMVNFIVTQWRLFT